MRLIPLAIVVLLLGMPSWSQTPMRRDMLLPLVGTLSHEETVQGGVPIQAVAVSRNDSEFTSALGMYAFDSSGNCIAWDDVGEGVAADRVAVAFVPERSGLCYVHVRNLGRHWNRVEFQFGRGR